MKASVFRRAHFNAAHRLHNPRWGEAENKRVFGPCNNPNHHGHNYELEVKVTGEIDPETGFVIDLSTLKKIIHEEVHERFDHKNLNLDTPEFARLNPTAENIAAVIWQKIRPRLENDLQLCVRLYETPRNFVEFWGE